MEQGTQLDFAKSKQQRQEAWDLKYGRRPSLGPKSTSEQPEPISSSATKPVEPGSPPSTSTTLVGAPSVPKLPAIDPRLLSLGPTKKKFELPSEAKLTELYKKNLALYEELVKHPQYFISPNFHPDFVLLNGFVLVGGVSGKSKTTVNANILAGFVEQNKSKKALVITNEDPMDGVYNRVACLQLGIHYGRYQKGLLKPAAKKAVQERALSLISQIRVAGDEEWDLTYLEDVGAVLDYAADHHEEIGLVTLDYVQTVNQSRLNRTMEPWAVYKKLGFRFKEYGKKLAPPVIGFAQLIDSKDGSIKHRVEGDKHLFNHAFECLEVVPDFKALRTKFIVRKSRYGLPPEGTEIEAEFKDGALLFKGEEEQF